jgi:CheY-like chemotaxis protein
MGGELSVESTVGIGTTFSFSIVLGIVPINANIGAPANTVPLDGRSALVVDDNATNRRILRRQLEGWGMTVTEAETGEVAVALVMGGAAFDVALVDMKMPEMSGTELEEILASMPATRTLPVILLSSRGERRATSRPGVAREVLTKPVRQGYLHDVVQHALRSVDQPSLARSGGKAQPTSDVAPMRVLVAEDNPVNQRVGRLMLEKLGHHVDVVGNGREAFDAIRAAPYDVILMDLEMPDMDGLDATRAIRRELPADRQPRIVGLTASVLVEIRRDCIEAGMDDYLSKPVRLEELATVLQ